MHMCTHKGNWKGASGSICVCYFVVFFEGSLRQYSLNSTLSKGGGRFDTHSMGLIYVSGGLTDPHTQAHSSGLHTLLKHKLRAGFRQLWVWVYVVYHTYAHVNILARKHAKQICIHWYIWIQDWHMHPTDEFWLIIWLSRENITYTWNLF